MEEVKEILEEAAALAGATYISAGLSSVCRDYVVENLRTGERRDVIVADVVEFLLEQAEERFGGRGERRTGPQVRTAGQQAIPGLAVVPA